MGERTNDSSQDNPFLDDKLKLAGYELLFRARDANRAGVSSEATSQLILSSTMLFDWNSLVNGARASDKASMVV